MGGGQGFEFFPASLPALCVCYQRKRRKMEQNLEQNLSRAQLGTQPVEFDTFVEEKTTTGLISDTNSSNVVSGVSLFGDHPKGTYIIGPVV